MCVCVYVGVCVCVNGFVEHEEALMCHGVFVSVTDLLDVDRHVDDEEALVGECVSVYVCVCV